MPDPIVMAEAAGLAAIVAVVLARLTSRFGLPGGALGVGVGVFLGSGVLGLLPRVPPRESLDRFLLLLVPASVLTETLATLSGRIRSVGWVLRVVVAASATPVLVLGSTYVADLSGPGSREWAPGETRAIYAGAAIVLVLVQSVLNRLAHRAGRSTAAAVAVAASGAAIAVMLSGYATGGQLVIPVAAGVAAFAVVGSRHAAGAVPVATLSLFSLLVIGKLFAGLTTQNAVILFAAPLLAWLPEVPGLVRRIRPQLRGVLRVLLTAIPVVITLWFAQQKFAADSNGPAADAPESLINDYMNFGK